MVAGVRAALTATTRPGELRGNGTPESGAPTDQTRSRGDDSPAAIRRRRALPPPPTEEPPMARATGAGSQTAADTRFRGNRAADDDGRSGDTAPGDDNITAQRADYSPAGADGKPTAGGTLKRTLKEFSEDNLTDWAAALTYYG